MIKKLAMIAAATIGVSGSAGAAIITQTYDIQASFFRVDFAGLQIGEVPVDPVHLNFTLIYDNSMNIVNSTTGLTVNTFNLPYQVRYTYRTDIQGLIVASALTPDGSGCFDLASSFCAIILPISNTQFLDSFVQFAPSGGGWSAGTLALNGNGPPPPVPEPATWGTMLIGFGVIGSAMRRRKVHGRLRLA